MGCEACNIKFTFFTRKKQCIECLRYFCSECVIKQSDKTISCGSCSVLSQRPLSRSQVIQMRAKDLYHYLLTKRVSVKGCIEKEDLIKVLLVFANGSSTEEISNINLSANERSDLTTSEKNVFTNVPARPDIIKLSDINTLLELECLSAKQLKNLLNTNRVDYKGCIERCELLDKASRLWEQYKRSKTDVDTLDENLCKICWDEPVECVILECGHMVCCLKCGKQMSECPICKQYVVRVVRVFKS